MSNLDRFEEAVSGLDEGIARSVENHLFGAIVHDIPAEVFDAALERALAFATRAAS